MINQIQDMEDFKSVVLPEVEAMGIPVLACIPREDALGRLSVADVAEVTLAKVIAASEHTSRLIRHILIGASSDREFLDRIFKQEDKLIITSGDRDDIILAAIEHSASAVVLTNNVLPGPQMVSIAQEKQIPLLLVAEDTFRIAKKVDDMEALVRVEDTARIEKIVELVKNHMDLGQL